MQEGALHHVEILAVKEKYSKVMLWWKEYYLNK